VPLLQRPLERVRLCGHRWNNFMFDHRILSTNWNQLQGYNHQDSTYFESSQNYKTSRETSNDFLDLPRSHSSYGKYVSSPTSLPILVCNNWNAVIQHGYASRRFEPPIQFLELLFKFLTTYQECNWRGMEHADVWHRPNTLNYLPMRPQSNILDDLRE
jgi:hypothetical protein